MGIFKNIGGAGVKHIKDKPHGSEYHKIESGDIFDIHPGYIEREMKMHYVMSEANVKKQEDILSYIKDKTFMTIPYEHADIDLYGNRCNKCAIRYIQNSISICPCMNCANQNFYCKEA